LKNWAFRLAAVVGNEQTATASAARKRERIAMSLNVDAGELADPCPV
jgi:hypothetical protein